MVNNEQLWVLLQNFLHKELQQIESDSVNIEHVDEIILKMLVDYRAKAETPVYSKNSEPNLDVLHHELDQAIEWNRKQFEEITRSLKQ
ncbi:hypothetical protein [Ornithinibacillus xuwenensis]|uniref:Uncharacterized protein n=1 Tax=Ornithinibacillus xuwenensis TaxID=3144668 RepID=A0ABU9XLT4_9BACI